MTVEEALISAATAHLGQSGRLFQAFPPPAAKARADEMIELLQMGAVARRKCSNISHGDQKLLDVGLALALDPKVLLLDEPTAGHGPGRTLGDDQHRPSPVGNAGHDADLHRARHGYRLRGRPDHQRAEVWRVLASGPPEAIRGNPDVIEAYLGTEMEEDA